MGRKKISNCNSVEGIKIVKNPVPEEVRKEKFDDVDVMIKFTIEDSKTRKDSKKNKVKGTVLRLLPSVGQIMVSTKDYGNRLIFDNVEKYSVGQEVEVEV